MISFEKVIGSTALAVLLTSTTLDSQAAPQIPEDCKISGFAIGCMAWTFNHFSAFEAIEKTAQVGGKVIEFYPGQKLSKEEPNLTVDHNASDEVLAKLRAKLKEQGIKAVGYGVLSIPGDEAGARQVFKFAKKMGLRYITTESTESINVIEKLVKEYDICVGFHNHAGSYAKPEYKVWDPLFIAGVVAGRDPRIGATADIGHWCASNIKPIDGFKNLKGRIIGVHLMDNRAFGESQVVPCGQGVADIKSCLDELKAQGFSGSLSIEYEDKIENNSAEVKQCVEFVRQYGSGK